MIYRNINTTIIIVLLSLLHGVTASAQVDISKYQQLKRFPYVIVSDSSITTPPPLTDEHFDSIAAGVRFKVNKTDINPLNPFIINYRDSLLPLLKLQGLQLRSITLRGAASPEGPYENNKYLARTRTRKLENLLTSLNGQSKLALPDMKNMVTATPVYEDYGRLVRMMRDRQDPDLFIVRQIYEDYKGDEPKIKQRLKVVEKGKLWNRLLKEYFPALRESRVVMWFVRPGSTPSFKSTLQKVPTTGRIAFLEADTARQFIEPIEIVFEKTYRRPKLSVKSNLLLYGLYVQQYGYAPAPNVALEWFPYEGHWTYGAEFDYTWWNKPLSTHKVFQIRNYQLETRRYFKPRYTDIEYKGAYVNAYIHTFLYDFGFTANKGYQGEGLGGGLGLGYAFNISKNHRWRIDTGIQVGYLWAKYDPYRYGCPIDQKVDGKYYYEWQKASHLFTKRKYHKGYVGPTKAWFSLTYDLLYWHKNGKSTKKNEAKKGGEE